ncbi:MAG TPA: nuclear transport factor 2 family protein [Gemmatimonadales bacterium]|nr:nuclear transport factor 2 family protein [Gemmatimonadales bacterium]
MRLAVAASTLLLAGCAAAASPAAEAGPTPPAEAMAAAQEIMRLEEAWGRALSARDTAFFHQTLADDFVGTGGSGTRSKAMVIAELVRGVGSVPVPRLEDTQVRLFDDVAIVTGVAVYQGTSGTPESRTRFTEVWVKRAGRWQAVHGHYNAVPADS